MYELQIMTQNGSVNDVLYFNTLEEAKEEREFYKYYYSDRKFKYRIVKENLNLIFKRKEVN